jgi:hypothetical protein
VSGVIELEEDLDADGSSVADARVEDNEMVPERENESDGDPRDTVWLTVSDSDRECICCESEEESDAVRSRVTDGVDDMLSESIVLECSSENEADVDDDGEPVVVWVIVLDRDSVGD